MGIALRRETNEVCEDAPRLVRDAWAPFERVLANRAHERYDTILPGFRGTGAEPPTHPHPRRTSVMNSGSSCCVAAKIARSSSPANGSTESSSAGSVTDRSLAHNVTARGLRFGEERRVE